MQNLFRIIQSCLQTTFLCPLKKLNNVVPMGKRHIAIKVTNYDREADC